MTNEPAFGSAFLLPSPAVAMPLGKKRTRTYYPQQEDGFFTACRAKVVTGFAATTRDRKNRQVEGFE